jgi:aminoglycoside phosphotransferase family enzyme/predicted kinase
MSQRKKSSNSLISALMNPGCYDHAVKDIQLIETHISWIILTGDFAYKIKKPVDFGFLDFSSLEKRHLYCREELRLNKRLAPDLYLAVVSINGTPEKPELDGKGDAFEYAVKMRQFPPASQLDHVLERGELQPGQLDAVARLIAEFHQGVSCADVNSDYGDPAHVHQPVEENFIQIRQHIPSDEYLESLAELQRWSETRFAEIKSIFEKRKIDGFIRECHGDMHLSNLAWHHDAPLVFDCIEFNPNLYWIDVINDVAFLVMDLQDRQQTHLAYRFLNTYLESTGDYPGIATLRFYLVYRAMVLAKVHAIRARQTADNPEKQRQLAEGFANYMRLGKSYIYESKPRLIITHGLSGSGKSTVTGQLLEQLGAIRIRSDVERKRLFDIRPEENIEVGHGEGIYSARATQRTYDRLAELAGTIIDAGYPVIVDAAFLQFAQREPFRKLALEKQVPYVIVEFTTAVDTLRQRISDRKGDVSDANLAILEKQISVCEKLHDNELGTSVTVNTENDIDIQLLLEQMSF